MTSALSAGGVAFGNPGDLSILTTGDYTPPSSSPDSERLLGPVWTPSGLSLDAPCRLYCGDRWRSGTITATGETFALVATSTGVARCTDRRNLLGKEEARIFKNSQHHWRKQRKAALKLHEEGQNHG